MSCPNVTFTTQKYTKVSKTYNNDRELKIQGKILAKNHEILPLKNTKVVNSFPQQTKVYSQKGCQDYKKKSQVNLFCHESHKFIGSF